MKNEFKEEEINGREVLRKYDEGKMVCLNRGACTATPHTLEDPWCARHLPRKPTIGVLFFLCFFFSPMVLFSKYVYFIGIYMTYVLSRWFLRYIYPFENECE